MTNDIEYEWDTSIPDPPPDEEILLVDEQGSYDKMPPGIHELKMSGLSPFLMKTLHEAHSAGHLGQTAQHYAKELEAAGVLDSDTLDDFKDLAEEAYENRHEKAAVDIVHEKMRELVGGFTIRRRNNGDDDDYF